MLSLILIFSRALTAMSITLFGGEPHLDSVRHLADELPGCKLLVLKQ